MNEGGRLAASSLARGLSPVALRVNLLPFVVLVTIGKLARYAAVLAVALAWVGQGA